ncbi:Uncharacterised protein [Mycobacteroides abscessus subsp. abscessus]|uniref:hypothetical protein n=1 Tax=Mycobacteroides abscessus TaxID=36809 RepID=UPI00092C8280|nr:hypothetical protein [Mycobacteroides abscessus]SII09225.1 Uncharacterised protein [Mycobacteroides abscessus subsp. abscessus]SLH24795.1 Uncharacterised protein [Mycobacteroides abscessus subsp. abscessus]SLJ13234.1 Uncharacterised protein [Mycobacteroides abscessus subsp. abscessus]
MDDLIGRIDSVLDDESLDDDVPWVDAWHWAPPEVALPEGVWEDEPDSPLDLGWDYHPDAQIHAIPAHQVSEWTRWLGTMPVAEREDVAWFVVCFQCMTAGEREVSCGCGNPSSSNDFR